jgi:hypothetical protein
VTQLRSPSSWGLGAGLKLACVGKVTTYTTTQVVGIVDRVYPVVHCVQRIPRALDLFLRFAIMKEANAHSYFGLMALLAGLVR